MIRDSGRRVFENYANQAASRDRAKAEYENRARSLTP